MKFDSFKKAFKLKRKKALNNERGTAMVETLPLIAIFMVLLAFGLGFFGVIHTAILNSIGARTYAFETFSLRSDTNLFRDRRELFSYANRGNRIHRINSDRAVGATNADNNIYATDREIQFGRRSTASTASINDHNQNIYNLPQRNRKGGVEVSPVWIMVGYGLCLNSRCGD